jgi:hypothetical protein
MASLFWTISGHDPGAIVWLRHQQISVAHRYGGCYPESSAGDMETWAAAYAGDSEWQEAKTNPLHPWRQTWQWWVVQQAVAAAAMTQLQKGLRLPAFFITDSIRECWNELPQSDASRRRLRAIANTPHAGKNFRRSFRNRFDLRWGAGPPRRALGANMIARRARIYLQWLQWLRHEASPGVVYLNMDETRLSSIREWKHGIVAKHPTMPGTTPTATPSPPVTTRTTLLATVCSRDDWQPRMPQIRLPKCRPGKLAPRKDRFALHHAGAPQQVWHGTPGVATAGIIRRWMTCIRAAIDRLQPGTQIVLILDCCPAHMSRCVLSHARRLRMRLAIIPARLTWLLQPLDTHVFAQLKNDIRARLARLCIARNTGHVSTADAIRTHGDAIAAVVSGRTWSASMTRTGATGEPGNLRPSIRALIRNEPMHPRPPTIDDIACMLNVSRKRAAALATGLAGEEPPEPARSAKRRTAALTASPGAAEPCARRLAPMPLPRALRLPVFRQRRDGRPSSPARLFMAPATAPTAHSMMTRSRRRWLTATAALGATRTRATDTSEWWM